MQEITDLILERLSAGEGKINSNEEQINSLKIALIVISVFAVALISAAFMALWLLIKKINNQKKFLHKFKIS